MSDAAPDLRSASPRDLGACVTPLFDLERPDRPQHGALDELVRRCEQYETALREIGVPTHVPAHFDPLDYWKHTACKRGEIARDALGVTAEELIRDAQA